MKHSKASDFDGLRSPVTASLGLIEPPKGSASYSTPSAYQTCYTDAMSIMKEKALAGVIITTANKQRKTLADRRNKRKKRKKNLIQQETSDTMTGSKQSAVTS